MGILPFALHFYEDAKGKLCTSTKFSYSVCAEEILGLELQYPKNVWLKTADDYELVGNIEAVGNGQVYENIKRTITQMTKPLQIQIGEEKKSTGVRISPAAKPQYVGKRFLLSQKDVGKVGTLNYKPLYMILYLLKDL